MTTSTSTIGVESRDRGTADVLDPDRQIAERGGDERAHAFERLRPPRVVGDDHDRLGPLLGRDRVDPRVPHRSPKIVARFAPASMRGSIAPLADVAIVVTPGPCPAMCDMPCETTAIVTAPLR